MSKTKSKSVERVQAAYDELRSRFGEVMAEFEAMKARAEKAEARCEDYRQREENHRRTRNAMSDRQRELTQELERVRKHWDGAVRTLRAIAGALQAAVEQMDCDPDDCPF